MCLNLRGRESCVPASIATEDIICYKVLRVDGRRLESPYRGSRYRLNTLRKSRLKKESRASYSWEIHQIETGLHSYSNLTSATSHVRHAGACWRLFVFVAIIPKGAMYYKGDFTTRNDSYASNRMVVLHREDPRSLEYIANTYPKGYTPAPFTTPYTG